MGLAFELIHPEGPADGMTCEEYEADRTWLLAVRYVSF